MKKLFLLITMLLSILSIACTHTNADGSDNEEALLYVEGVIADINRMGVSFTINIEEESSSHLTESVIVRVPRTHIFKYAQIKKGDSIRVGYDGVIMESYPVQISGTNFEMIDD
ncbi:hypothetical protein DH09_01925 [Bacillaceae bacterium JMAK1]|nr:hypothetical protein DH09_01925 [Bacillaceae bacterium JMAK1]